MSKRRDFEIRKTGAMGDLTVWMVETDLDQSRQGFEIGRVSYPLLTVHQIAASPDAVRMANWMKTLLEKNGLPDDPEDENV